MIGFWLKRILRDVTLHISYEQGDLVTVRLLFKGTLVFERTVDIVKDH